MAMSATGSDRRRRRAAAPDARPATTPLRFAVREMAFEDLPEVFALGQQIFTPEDYPNLYRTWDEYDLIQMFASDGEFCLVAENRGDLLGFVLGTIIEKRRSAWKYGYIVWLGVQPQLESRGVARKLCQRLTELFIDAGARMILVDTEAENERAVAFFRRLGYGHPVEHLYMTKNLTTLPEYRERRKHARTPRHRETHEPRPGQVLPRVGTPDGQDDDTGGGS